MTLRRVTSKSRVKKKKKKKKSATINLRSSAQRKFVMREGGMKDEKKWLQGTRKITNQYLTSRKLL